MILHSTTGSDVVSKVWLGSLTLHKSQIFCVHVLNPFNVIHLFVHCYCILVDLKKNTTLLWGKRRTSEIASDWTNCYTDSIPVPKTHCSWRKLKDQDRNRESRSLSKNASPFVDGFLRSSQVRGSRLHVLLERTRRLKWPRGVRRPSPFPVFGHRRELTGGKLGLSINTSGINKVSPRQDKKWRDWCTTT